MYCVDYAERPYPGNQLSFICCMNWYSWGVTVSSLRIRTRSRRICMVVKFYNPTLRLRYGCIPMQYVSLSVLLECKQSSKITLYKLYAVPVRVCSTREDMHYPWVISSVPVSHILSTREGMHYLWVISSVPVSHILSTCEDMQYPWVISSVPVRICSTRESYHQYPWVISSVPVRICSTRESYPQYPWVISSVRVRICSTRESYHQYPWVISSVPVRICSTRE